VRLEINYGWVNPGSTAGIGTKRGLGFVNVTHFFPHYLLTVASF